MFVCAIGHPFGQGERGTFNGTVGDPSGAVIAGATVKAVNVATNVETTSTTTDAGVYRMPQERRQPAPWSAYYYGQNDAFRANGFNNNAAGGGTLGYNGSINRNSGNTTLRFAEDVVFNLHDRFPDFTATLPNKGPSLSNGLNIDYTARNSNRLPYTQNWNIGIQYQLPAAMVLEMNYIGNKGTRLIMKGFDNLNALPFSVIPQYGDLLPRPWTPATGVPEPFPGFAGTVIHALRPYPQFVNINQLFPNFGTSSYNSFQTQLSRHFRGGFSLLAAYTWSKAIGYTDNAIDAETPVDQFNREPDRSVTNYHIPHFAKVTWIYELPIGPGKLLNVGGIAGKIIGGWQISGIHQFRTAAPLSISTGGITNPLGTARADLVPGQEIVINPDAPLNFRGFAGGQTYLNRAAFANPPVFPGGQNVVQRFGTLGPVLPNIRDLHVISEQFNFSKAFKFDEFRSFELRCVINNNPFQRVGRGGLITNITDPNFGQFTGQQYGPRNLELSGRLPSRPA